MSDHQTERWRGIPSGLLLRPWVPPGNLDPATGVWVTDEEIPNEFPEEGVLRFRTVDEHSFWFAHRNQVIVDRLRRRLEPGSVVFDIGAGSGIVSAALQRAGFCSVAVEPHPVGAATAVERGLTAGICGDLASLELPSGSVPALGAFDVVEHIEDPGPFLDEVRRVVSPTGLVVLTVPAYGWLWSSVDDWNGHHRRYTSRRLRGELEAAGFSVLEDTYLFAPLVPPAFLVRVVKERLSGPPDDGRVGEQVQEGLDPANAIVRRAIGSILRAEAAVLRRGRIPFGTSLLVLASPRHA